jgi:hypothetical protein
MKLPADARVPMVSMVYLPVSLLRHEEAYVKHLQ